MEKFFTFEDVLIKPQFSHIKSRKDVDISSQFGSIKLSIPAISANMDTVTNVDVAIALSKQGALGCLHRFSTIEENVSQFKAIKEQNQITMCSIGLGENEFTRATALIDAGCKLLCIDVAHGAQIAVVDQYNAIKNYNKDVEIIVGNFATGETISEFRSLCKSEPLGFKVGIGGGSACLTRVQTGCGVPQLSALIQSIQLNKNVNIIADGGIKHPGDIAKALAVGSKAVMLGSMFAGCEESPGEIINNNFKHYRGSASQESYEVQGKVAKWRTFEGDSFLVPYKGPISNVLHNIEGGLRSAFTYVGAKNLEEFQQKAELIKISAATITENIAHGKK
jgi:IMP dehydrogenase